MARGTEGAGSLRDDDQLSGVTYNHVVISSFLTISVLRTNSPNARHQPLLLLEAILCPVKQPLVVT